MYKKLLSTFIIASVSATIGFAQQPTNAGFESTWVAQTGYSEPPGWGTPNLLSSSATIFGANAVSVSQATSPNVNSGTYAVKISTIKYTPGFVDISTYLPNDTFGFVFSGKIMPSSPYLFPGYTQTTRYAQLDFYAKYTPVGSDQGTCTVFFQKRNGTKVDTIAYGATLIASNTSFAKLSVPLTYKSGLAPDTATIIFNSSYTKPQIGSALWVDDLSFSGLVAGINERNMLLNAIKVFPNPATDNITFAASVANESLSLVEIFDATGRRIDGIAIQNNRHELNVNKYAEGLYMYNAYNDKKELIGIGKFNVTK